MDAAVATIGHNRSPFDLASEEIDGLYAEAKNWLDGEAIASQDHADALSKLLDMIREAEKRADAARKAEKKPHDDAAKAVQERYKPLLERAATAASVCKQALTPWLEKLDREKREAERKAREDAEAAERAAQEAFRQAGVGDLEEREEAERLAKAAKVAAATASRAENDRAQAKGGKRAVSLRTYAVATVEDPAAFARWVWSNRFAELEAWLAELAQREASKGARALPGVTVTEERRAV